jgi:hypothetical protein
MEGIFMEEKNLYEFQAASFFWGFVSCVLIFSILVLFLT